MKPFPRCSGRTIQGGETVEYLPVLLTRDTKEGEGAGERRGRQGGGATLVEGGGVRWRGRGSAGRRGGALREGEGLWQEKGGRASGEGKDAGDKRRSSEGAELWW